MLSPWPRLLALGATLSSRPPRCCRPPAWRSAEPQMGDSDHGRHRGEPTSVDPAFDYDFVSGLATSSITEPLLKFCEGDTALCPHLATDWTVSPDGLTYTLTIRQDVKFHDGSPMTVDDVLFSLDRVRDPALGSYVGWMLANVADVTAPDDQTVVITMTQPDALLEYALASTAAHVVSKAFVESVDEDYGTPGVGSIGTGPFKFVEWVSGDHQKLARNDDYWDKANGGPYLDQITIKILPSPPLAWPAWTPARSTTSSTMCPPTSTRRSRASTTSASRSCPPTSGSGSPSTPRNRPSTTSRFARP